MLKKVTLTNSTTNKSVTTIVDIDTDEGALVGSGKSPNEIAKISDITGLDEKIQRMSSPSNSLDDRVALLNGVSRCLDRNIATIKSFELQANRVSSPRYKGMIASICEQLSLGEQVSTAMAQFPWAFGPEVISLVEAGEESGRLPEVFRQLATSQKKTLRIIGKLKSGMIYPAIVIVLAVAVIIVISMTLVPAVSKLYSNMGAELPAATIMMMKISETLISKPWTALIPFVALGILFKNWGKITSQAWFQRIAINIPTVGPLVRKSAAAISFRTLAMLMDSHVRLSKSLEITAGTAPHIYYKTFFRKVKEHIDYGLGFSESFLMESEYLGDDARSICGILEISEETGGANDMLHEIAADYEEDLDTLANQIDKILEPLTMVLLGGMVGFLIYAIYSPIFNLGDVLLPK